MAPTMPRQGNQLMFNKKQPFAKSSIYQPTYVASKIGELGAVPMQH
jgi:hypothetical protein